MILIFLDPPVLIYTAKILLAMISRSGYYVLQTYHLFAYSNMELDCDGNKGGWMILILVKEMLVVVG